MRKWKRNWMIKRMVLGFAVAALVVPAVAQARVDSGIGMPNRAGLNDYLKARDGIEVVRLQPRNEVRSGDLIENVRLAPRSVSTPQVVSSPGFDWSDAGIGAGLALALVLAGGAAFIATRHMGRTQTA